MVLMEVAGKVRNVFQNSTNFETWVNPSATDFRDWGSDFGGFEAVTGKSPHAMSIQRKENVFPKILTPTEPNEVSRWQR